MHIDDLILISVDDHVIEPPDLFDAHLPDDLKDRAPKIVRRADGSDVWRFGDVEVPNLALNAVAGRPPEEYNFEPTSFDEIRRGTWDVHDRVRDMSANGVLASMNFPSMTGFCGQLFMKTPDRAVGLRMLQAYNDWHILEWCGSYPDRFIPQAVAPGWDPQAMADETRRVAAMGCHSITFSENPAKLGLPSLHSETWDPFWKACSDEGTVVNMHIGSSSSLPMTAADAPVDVTIALTPLNAALALGDLIFSRVIREFPDLRIALNEGGFGWMPWFLERCDYTYKQHHAWTGSDFGGKLPSEVFRERFLICFVDDPIGMRLRDKVNFDNVMWECDYPHSDSTWPHSPERLVGSLDGLSADEVAKVTHRNVMHHYQFDPFSIRPQGRCTVGALRAEANDVDTSYQPAVKRQARQGASDLAAIIGRQQATV